MGSFFSNAIMAGNNTLHALFHGPSKCIEEMHAAQKVRFETFKNMMSSISYKPHQIKARQQYWCAQTFFLAQLIKNHLQLIESITNTKICVDNEASLLSTLNELIIALDNADNLKKFLQLLEQDCHTIEQTKIKKDNTTPLTKHSEIQFINGDVVELIKSLSSQGAIAVVDNAPNSHRDGAAKYSAGSLEELLSRHTDSALKMVLHFTDVHQRNVETGHYAFTKKTKTIDVDDYKKRYLQMVLTICAKLLQKNESYLNSDEFFKDLFTAFPNPNENSSQLPIFFDIQNNVYEVPVNGGFTSSHWFLDTKELSTVTNIFEKLKSSPPPTPIEIVSYAAPDLRHFETTPLDVRATSNKILQHPREEGLLGCMLSEGIKLQCQRAIALANNYKEQGIEQQVTAVFVMPGCGAFKNPEKNTAAHFISTIKYFYPLLQAHNVNCYVAEYDSKLHHLLKQTSETYGPQLGELNILINSLIPSSSLRQKAIKVREQILKIIEADGYSEELNTHLELTIQLLKTSPGETRSKIVEQYKENAMSMQKNNNPLWMILGATMLAFAAALVTMGAALSITGGGSIPGIGIVDGGILLAVAGFGIFTHNKYKKLTDISEELAEDNTETELHCSLISSKNLL